MLDKKGAIQITVKENSKEAEKSEKQRGTLLIIISAISFGLLAIFAKFAYAENIGVFTLLTLRFLMAGLLLGFFLVARKEKLNIDSKQLFKLIALGVMGYAVMSSCFFYAVKLIPASIAAIILYTYPILVTVLAYLFYREPITRYHTVALLLSFSGLILVVGVAFKGINLTGIGYAIGAAVVYSLYITISSKEVKNISPNVVSFYIILSAGFAFALGGIITESLNFNITAKGWLSVLGIAFFSTGVAIITFFKGMQLIGPSNASIVSTIEPIITTLAAFILFNEKITITQLLGGFLIIYAIIQIHKNNR